MKTSQSFVASCIIVSHSHTMRIQPRSVSFHKNGGGIQTIDKITIDKISHPPTLKEAQAIVRPNTGTRGRRHDGSRGRSLKAWLIWTGKASRALFSFAV